MPFPPDKAKLTIFDTEPAPDAKTFMSGVYGTDTQQSALSIIMFSPNLQIIASLDNSTSQATSTYEVSVTQGFTFSATQSISITSEVGVSIEIFTAKISTTFALSFTEQWNSSSTRSMTFTCPPGQKAFVYQGTLMAKILKFDAKTGQYAWVGAAAKALTQVVVTSATPIGSAPSNPVTIGPAK